MDLAALGGDPFFVAFEVEIQVIQGMDLDVAGGVAQGVEFGQPRDRLGALADEADLDVGQRALELRVLDRGAGVRLEGAGARVHGQL